MTKNKQSKSMTRYLGLLGLLGAVMLPSSSSATTNDIQVDPACTMEECAESVVVLEIDTLTGDVYLVDNDTGSLSLVGNEIPVYFGGQSRVLLHLQYTVGEWEVQITPPGGAPETFETVGGSLRYFLESDEGNYVFSSEEAEEHASTMTSMAPVPPGEIIIMPDPSCPPG